MELTEARRPVYSQEDLKNALYKYFGFNNFKPLQIDIIQNVMKGLDTFVIMPTGGGKSLCYQLPALLLPGTAIIVSPLIALMKNQVDSIRGYSENDEVAHFLNSSLTRVQARKVKDDINSGKSKLLFIAPETLTKEENREFFRSVPVSFVAVDEAHCISEWGHDFRPEYRHIREMVESIGDNIPVVALTATATPKVKSDIVKNLNMEDVGEFISSFNRTNLYYEVRPKVSKVNAFKEIVKYIQSKGCPSGIIYVQSRKSTEEIAEVLQVNGINAGAYHAGMDSKSRTRIQDAFLMEELDVICATIAFGMGIDKPDVRFVIHYDIPKSIENYYQETGRAGRDGIESDCVAFYSYKDILRLEKFLRDKPLSEREMGAQLMDEMVAYSETSACRRQFLLHYFGEDYDTSQCTDLCDNCRHPKEKIPVRREIKQTLMAIEDLGENYPIKTIVEYLTGRKTKQMADFKFDQLPRYGIGAEKDDVFWHSVIRQSMLQNLVYKEIESYGLIKLKPKGRAFIKKPYDIEIAINRNFDQETDDVIVNVSSKGSAALDDILVKLLKDLRKDVAQKKNIPPYIIFQDPSLEDMATQYPISLQDMSTITGVSKGKAVKYGLPFITLIKKYVEENDIERPTDFVIKQKADKSRIKVNIIQSTDKKMPFEDIAYSNSITMDELLAEMYMIVSSGTKLNIDYYLDEMVDEYTREDIVEYFMESETDSIDEAFAELEEDDITLEEITLVRLKFLSEHAN